MLQNSKQQSLQLTGENNKTSDLQKANEEEQIGNDKHKYLDSIYKKTIAEANFWFIFSISIAVLGIILVLGGVFAIFLFSKITAGTLTSIAGIVTEVINQLAFHPAENAIKRRQDISNKIDQESKITIATQIAMSASKGVRDQLLDKIITSLISPEATRKENNEPPS